MEIRVTSKLGRTTLIAIVALALPALALAASPQKGKTYIGTKGGGTTSVSKKVSLKVSSSGKTGQASLYCGSARTPSTTPKFKITKGKFTATKKTGSITLWSLTHGKFTSSSKATARLNVVTTCDGKSDGPITLNLKTTTPSSGY
jgi:hypothetical protein